MARIASRPLMPGIRRSIRITSGVILSSSARPSAPLEALATTSIPGWVLSMLANPARTTGWSSIIMIRTRGGFSISAADGPRNRPEPRSDCRFYFHLSAEPGSAAYHQRGRNTFRSLAHSEQTETGMIAVRNKAVAIVFHAKAKRSALLPKPDPYIGRGGMPDRIGNGFLSDSEKRVFDMKWQITAVIFSLRLDCHLSILHHPFRAFTQSGEQPDMTERFRAQAGDAAARLLMTGARH